MCTSFTRTKDNKKDLEFGGCAVSSSTLLGSLWAAPRGRDMGGEVGSNRRLMQFLFIKSLMNDGNQAWVSKLQLLLLKAATYFTYFILAGAIFSFSIADGFQLALRGGAYFTAPAGLRLPLPASLIGLLCLWDTKEDHRPGVCCADASEGGRVGVSGRGDPRLYKHRGSVSSSGASRRPSRNPRHRISSQKSQTSLVISLCLFKYSPLTRLHGGC